VHATRQAFFFEPMSIRNLEDAPDQLAVPFTRYPNLVYSPHTYTHVFTVDAELGLHGSPYPLSYDQAYDVADAEARSLHAALLVGEYGNSASDDETILRPETAAQDRARAGSAIYAWKGACGADSTLAQCNSGWSVYAGDPGTPPAQNAALIPSRVKFLARAYPRATVGRLLSYSFNPDTKAFTMTATAEGKVEGETIVFVPAQATGAATVGGAARLVRVVSEPDGTRLVVAAPTGHGEYRVSVSGL
jgi:hypothetical protein